MAGLFGIAWAVTAGLELFQGVYLTPWLMGILGLGLIWSMSQVYRLRAAPSWNTWRTLVAFFLSATVLGVLGVRLLMPLPGWELVTGLALVAELGLMLTAIRSYSGAASRLRVALLGLGILGALFTIIFTETIGIWMAVLIFVIALIEEVIGRWQFYAGRVPFPFRSN